MDELIKKIPIFALEGSAFAGKTTLLNFLKQNYSNQVITIPEVGEYVGGDKNFPDVPFKSVEEAKKSTHFFIEIELQRYHDAISLYKKCRLPVIMDRFTFLSSLFFYKLLKKTKTQSEEMFSKFYNHAHTLFSSAIDNQNIIPPTVIVFIKTKDRDTFEKRLSRGTKNSVFTSWKSCQYMNDLYQSYIKAKYPNTHIFLNSTNSKRGLFEMTEKTIHFINKYSSSEKPKRPLTSLQTNEKRVNINLSKESTKYSQTRKRVKRLIKNSNLNII